MYFIHFRYTFQFQNFHLVLFSPHSFHFSAEISPMHTFNTIIFYFKYLNIFIIPALKSVSNSDIQIIQDLVSRSCFCFSLTLGPLFSVYSGRFCLCDAHCGKYIVDFEFCQFSVMNLIFCCCCCSGRQLKWLDSTSQHY